MALVITEKDKIIVGATLFVVIIVCDIAMVLGWQYRLYSNYRDSASRKKDSIARLKNDIGRLDQYKEKIFELDEKIGTLKLLIKDEKEIAVLIENISKLADNSGVKITQIKPVVDNNNLSKLGLKDGKFSEVGIQIVGESSFHQFGSFVGKVESAESFFKVSALEIEPSRKDYYVQNIRLSLGTFVNRE